MADCNMKVYGGHLIQTDAYFHLVFLLNAVKLNLIQVTEVVTTERFMKNCKECKILILSISSQKTYITHLTMVKFEKDKV